MIRDSTQNSLLHAKYCADSARHIRATVIGNTLIARSTYCIRLECPTIAEQIKPGQFVMLRLPGSSDPLLGRPLALYDVVCDSQGKPNAIDVVYLVVGKMTTLLAQQIAGNTLEIWGPLGNGFALPEVDHLVMVAGGIGQTPMLALGKKFLATAESDKKVTLCYGVRTADFLAGEEDFRSAGFDLKISSDDGSVGHHGFVTNLLNETLENDSPENCAVACCGPEPMMAAVAKICVEANVPCQVSLETPMACGIGICFSCVAKIKQADGEWDYKRTCVEGPIFTAEEIVW